MRSLRRIAWVLPLIAACGSTSVHKDDPSDDGGSHRATGGEGGRAGFEDGGLATGGRPNPPPGSGGSVPGSGGFFGGDGGFFGGDGGFFGGDGGFFGTGAAFGGSGFFGAGGSIPEAGGSFGTGAFFGAGGQGTGGSTFGTGGRLVDPACCEAIPFCRAGYDQVSGPGECVRGDICYEATACCSTIWCKAHPDQDAGACNAVSPPGVQYVSVNASVCDRREWKCPTNTYQYWDTCGCGCSQDTSCPATVDCTAVSKDPLCTDNAPCPYTNRIF